MSASSQIYHNYFNYPLRIYTEDTDYGGVVYHANYIRFMERARLEWMAYLNILEPLHSGNYLFAVRSINVDYFKPFHLYDQVIIATRIKTLKRASIIFEHELHLAGNKDKIFCHAEVKIACVDQLMRPKMLPELPFFTSIRRQLT